MKTRKVRAIYSYQPQNIDELELNINDIVDVIDVVEEGWWKGLLRGKVGVFPSNFVEEINMDSSTILSSNKTDIDLEHSSSDLIKDSGDDGSQVIQIIPKKIGGVPTAIRLGVGSRSILKPVDDKRDRLLPKKPPPPAPATVDEVPAPKLPPKPAREQAKVLFSYEAQNDDELSIKEGDIITIINKEIEDQGWWKGELNGRIGVFPDNFVELIKTPIITQQEDLPPRKKIIDKQLESKTLNIISTHSPPVIKKSFAKDIEEKSSSVITTNNITSTSPVSFNLPQKKVKPLREDNLDKNKNCDQNNDHNNEHHQNHYQHNFGAIETKSPLKHLTANRAKGPKDRRPPSMIGLSVPNENDASIDQDDKELNNQNDSNKYINNGNNYKGSSEQISNKPVNQASSPQQQPVQWMLELKKKNEEKRKAAIVDETKAISTPSSPTKIISNRLSGDFSNKSFIKEPAPITTTTNNNTTTQQPISLQIENNHLPTIPNKPLKAAKPGSGNALTTAINSKPITGNAIKLNPESITVNSNIIDTSSNNCNNLNNNNAIMNDNDYDKEISDLRNELKHLKETTVTRSEYECLLKENQELRETIETQKQWYTTNIKDLINDSADTRKKLATLQIEVDRLRRLTTTV